MAEKQWECAWLEKGQCKLHEMNGLGCVCGQGNRQPAPFTHPTSK